jgi:pimeloyl-ACP methyl ester carboxylesterase
MVEFVERTVEVIGSSVALLEAGAGRPLLVLHEELGHPGALAWHHEMAKSRRLVIPIQPGFRGPRIGWMRGVRDLAAFYGFLARQEGLAGCDVIGFSFGGWVAAEMAVGDPGLFAKMALVAPFGIKPQVGFIKDMFPIASLDYLRASVADPEATPEFASLYGEPCPQQIEDWEDARAECARLGWEPYMHNISLPALVQGLTGLSTLILWGDKDEILPEDAVRTYQSRIPDARLEIIEGVGHRPESEATDQFLTKLKDFLG